ncbi:hypothetical protein ONS96_003460 [Cadophora gregata f. sp. sojae]|nr:hypothetical protein ONS96_003460 [Cadophora gregata f. sp. sojae]
MTGGQRTFTHIPTSLVRSNGQQRPMTSKAAKKAYQQANRGPKISRAEQHRRDKAELEQQKREYEREKAAERAKAAREKKAAKAAAEKEARKKQGIPEPSKFVRASQPTISRFVRTNSSNKRTWQQMESVAEDSDKTISDAEKDHDRPPAKRRVVDEGSDNEFVDFPSLSQSDLLEQTYTSMLSTKNGYSARRPAKEQRPSSRPRHREASQELPVMKDADEHAILNTQALDVMATTQLLSDLAEAVAKSGSLEPPSQAVEGRREVIPKPSASPRRSGRVAERDDKGTGVSTGGKCDTVPVVEIPYKLLGAIQSQSEHAFSDSQHEARDSLNLATVASRRVNMPPPRLPMKAVAATKSISTTQRPSIPPLKQSPSHGSKPLPTVPPSSTQAFLENHMDDFFPSPTQAVRELLEGVDDIPTNTQIARELSPKKAEKGLFENMFCTQDMIMSSDDLVEIVSQDGSLPKPLVEATPMPHTREESMEVGRTNALKNTENGSPADIYCSQDLLMSPENLPEAISPQPSPFNPLVEVASNDLNRRGRTYIIRETSAEKTITNDIDSFFGTQDLILSPEDLEEICSPVREPSLARVKPMSPDKRANPPPQPACRQKQRFFQEKEEDLYHAALHESKTTSAQGTNKAKNDPASCGRNQSDSTDYGEFDFDLPELFKEREDEELEAAIRESKITAELEAKRLALAGMPGLNRIQSNSTDYGDFDLPRLFDEQEEDRQNIRAGSETTLRKKVDAPTTSGEKAKPRRFFEEKYEDQVHAAIHESRMLAAKTIPLKQTVGVGSEKPKRTLKRVRSTATDYGDDDFMGCSQELINLC